MLKAWLLFLTLTITIVYAFATDVSVYDIQFPTDSIGNSPYLGQTVSTGGFVTALSYSGNVLYYFLSDRSGGLWHGILVNDNQDRHLTVGDSVHLEAEVQESNGQTRLRNVVTGSLTPDSVHIAPAVITCAALLEPAEGVLVEVHDVIVTAVTGTDFTVRDSSGSAIIGNGWPHVMPIVGDTLVTARGLVTSASNVFKINPRNDFDLTFTSNRPPVITGVRSNPSAPSNLDADTVTAHITDETLVADARVYYRFGGGEFTPLSMFDDGLHGDGVAADHVWGAIIPAGAPRSTCNFYVWATDDSGKFDTDPPDAPLHTYSYAVSPSMADIYTHVADYEQPNVTVTLVGVVNFVEAYTTSGGSNRISAYMQDNSGRGFYLSVSGSTSDFPTIVRGNRISVQGSITTYSGQIQIGPSSSSVTLLGTNQPNPAPIELKTGDRRLQREVVQTSVPGAYGTGTWCKFTGTIYRVDENVGGGTNIAMDDGTGQTTIRWWDSMHIDTVRLGDRWYHKRDLVGMYISIYGPSSTYNGDFQMLAAGDVSDFELPTTPAPASDFTLDVPNRPFAPDIGQHLKIIYNAPALGQVRLRVFDLRGRLVTTLVDKVSGGPNMIEWDGRDELNELLPIGTYLLHLESIRSGSSKTRIKPIVIGTKL